jgi:hypothetical protein
MDGAVAADALFRGRATPPPPRDAGTHHEPRKAVSHSPESGFTPLDVGHDLRLTAAANASAAASSAACSPIRRASAATIADHSSRKARSSPVNPVPSTEPR